MAKQFVIYKLLEELPTLIQVWRILDIQLGFSNV